MWRIYPLPMPALHLSVVLSMHGSFGIVLAAAEQQLGARILATGQNLVSNHQFYLADRQFSEAHPELLNTVVQQLNTTTQWIHNPQQAAQLLEPTGLSVDILSRSIARMGFGVQNISAQVVQQHSKLQMPSINKVNSTKN